MSPQETNLASVDESNPVQARLSVRFLLIAAIIVVIGYFGGKRIMTSVLYFQERAIVREKISKAVNQQYDDDFSGGIEPGLLGEEEE